MMALRSDYTPQIGRLAETRLAEAPRPLRLCYAGQVLTIKSDALDPAHHRILLMNCLAQGAALMAGKASEDPARAYAGDRPSTTFLIDDCDAAALGALIAFHEHRTFANAVLMGINPFDQFGVELGKAIAKQIESGEGAFDPSTRALMAAAGLA